MCVISFAAGMAAGALTFLLRSSVAEPHDPDANAIPAQVALGAVAVALVVVVSRSALARRAPHSIWAAPFSQAGFDRLRRTMSQRSGRSVPGLGRAVLAGLVAIALVFNFFRAGEQVIGGLDPNFTVNAWGGPSYLGAMLAHYLDALYLFYLEAALLNVVLVRPPARQM